MSWEVLAYLKEFYFFYEIWRFVMKMNRELGLTKCSECLLKWNISRIPLKVPKPWVESFLAYLKEFYFFLRNLTFCHENESGTRIWRNARNAYWNGILAGFPKSSPNMSWVVFGLFEGILLFLRNLTFCHENESGTRIWRNARNAYWNGILAGFP